MGKRHPLPPQRKWPIVYTRVGMFDLADRDADPRINNGRQWFCWQIGRPRILSWGSMPRVELRAPMQGIRTQRVKVLSND